DPTSNGASTDLNGSGPRPAHRRPRATAPGAGLRMPGACRAPPGSSDRPAASPGPARPDPGRTRHAAAPTGKHATPRVVAVSGGSTAAGTPDIVQQALDGAAGSLWLPVQQSDGSYVFQNKNSGLCLDVYGGGSNLGRRLDQWPCKNTAG